MFNKRFVQSEDKWVAFKPDSAGNYKFGFIYIDPGAGLTLDYQGSFTIDSDGKYLPKDRGTEGSVKVRLEANNRLVAFIPESKLVELKVDKIPDWLKHYKEGENTIERLYRWGFMYNGWGECQKALEFLERARRLDPDYEGVRVELAYSYNCLDRSSEAIVVLEEALKTNPTDAYMNKELIYAQAKTDQLDQAIISFNNALEVCKDKTYDAENAYQILYGYFKRKDSVSFDGWFKRYKNLLESDKRFPPIIEQLKAQLK